MEQKKSWYSTGFESAAKEEQRMAQMDGPSRIWLPAGSRREFVFLDDVPVTIYEHNPKMNNSYKNWVTCIKDFDEKGCPACESAGAKSRYYCGYFTVIDTSKWKDKKGNEHQFELNLLQAKLKTMKQLERKKSDAVEAGRSGLASYLYRATRDDDKSPACGNDFEFIREVDMTKLFELALYRGRKLTDLWAKAEASEEALDALGKIFKLEFDEDGRPLRKLVPFNYYEILSPKSHKELTDMFRGFVVPEKHEDTNETPF